MRRSGAAMPVAVVEAYDATLALLSARREDATVCPSEVARFLSIGAGGGTDEADWRSLMPVVHEAVDRLRLEARVRLSWKGQSLPSRAGSYRIGLVGS